MKSLTICLLVSTQYMNVTDGRTPDGGTGRACAYHRAEKTPFDDHPVEISRNRKERRRLESWQKYSAQSSRSHSTLASITLCRPVYRGHAYKLYKLRCSSVRVMFACSVITVWNSLPDVVNFTSLLAFNQSTRTVDFHEFLLCNNE